MLYMLFIIMGEIEEKSKALYKKMGAPEKNIFEDAHRTVIREMEAIKELDAESCAVYLVDAVAQITMMQQIALRNTGMKIGELYLEGEEDEVPKQRKEEEIKNSDRKYIIYWQSYLSKKCGWENYVFFTDTLDLKDIEKAIGKDNRLYYNSSAEVYEIKKVKKPLFPDEEERGKLKE